MKILVFISAFLAGFGLQNLACASVAIELAGFANRSQVDMHPDTGFHIVPVAETGFGGGLLVEKLFSPLIAAELGAFYDIRKMKDNDTRYTFSHYLGTAMVHYKAPQKFTAGAGLYAARIRDLLVEWQGDKVYSKAADAGLGSTEMGYVVSGGMEYSMGSWIVDLEVRYLKSLRNQANDTAEKSLFRELQGVVGLKFRLGAQGSGS